MKIHKFEIIENELSKSRNFASDLLDEISNEKKQLDFICEVGQKTSEIHKKILANFVKDVNDCLYGLDMNFCEVEESMYNAIGGYKKHISYLYFPRQEMYLIVRINGDTERIDGNQYLVQSGKYRFTYGKSKYNPNNTSHRNGSGLVENTDYYYLHSDNPIEHLLEQNKNLFKDELKK